MRLCLIVFMAVLCSTTAAQAQYYGGYYGGYHASTAAEGYAQGMASVVRSAGDYNLRTSEAAINYEQARSDNMDNRLKYTQTYFEQREMNKQYRQSLASPRASTEALYRFAKDAAPQKLSPSQLDPLTGDIAWPEILNQPKYDDQRKEIELLFREQAEAGKRGDIQTTMKIQKVAGGMTDELKKNIKEYPVNDYLAAKNFLEGLSYTADSPAG